jgi:hypothetical protein
MSEEKKKLMYLCVNRPQAAMNLLIDNITEVSGMAERMIPSIDSRLVCWAEHMDQGEQGGSGGGNMIATLMECKGDLTRSTVPGSSMPDAIYDTDRIIRKLDDKQPKLAQVVREHYQNASALPEQRYAACECSMKTYYRRLGKAHHAVLFMVKGGKATKSGERVAAMRLRKAG